MAAALPLHKVPAMERLSQLATVNVNQETSSGWKGNHFVVCEAEEVLFNLHEILPETIMPHGARRPFQFDGVDNTGTKVFSFNRPLGSVFILDQVDLYMNGNLVSVIQLMPTFLKSIFSINDAQGNPVIRLKGHTNKYFQLQTNDKAAIGSIEKKDGGWKKEFFTYKDDYIVNFPADLAVPFKIAVIVACIYIDFKYHEGK